MAKAIIFYITLLFTCFIPNKNFGQCPPNIDFEMGSFQNWTCWQGRAEHNNGVNILALAAGPPVPGRHTLYNSTGDGLDEYGMFPKNCPNGSTHSIKIGNNTPGAQAEGVSYQFTIPANANQFNLIYYYAVVFEDPNHPEHQQPRLEIVITNITDNLVINCSSFSFVSNSTLPGFYLSPVGNNVWYKDWSATTINLDGYEGKTIEIFFKSADCTESGHFGYAYIDVKSECSSSFVGTTYCPSDTAIQVTAPFGYQEYAWWNQNFTQLLGTSQTLYLNPPPPSGTNIKVELTPFDGYGCKDTMTAELLNTLTIQANAGPDKVSCAGTPVQIGSPPVDNLVYEWSPTTYLDISNIANPYATPPQRTMYILTVRSQGGGCTARDTVWVSVDDINASLEIIGPTSYCSATGQQTILKVLPQDSIQWFKDGVAIPGETQTQFTVRESGSYNAILFKNSGCRLSTLIKRIDIFPSPKAGFIVNNVNQCFAIHNIILTDTSLVTIGANAVYTWYMGDGTVYTDLYNINHKYTKAGTYDIKLLIITERGCKDSAIIRVIITPSPIPDFTVKDACINLPISVQNKTSFPSASYVWDFGNGITSTSPNPVYAYTVAGNYTISLTVPVCPGIDSTVKQNITVEEPVSPVQYPVVQAVMNFPERLQARNIGSKAIWNPPTSLDNRNSFTPYFKGLDPQLYTITITSNAGCVTVDTQWVKTYKKIEIYVPTVFTPGSDGRNDLLRPMLMGFKSVNYFRVYNRWGNLLFQMNSDRPGWNGKINNQLQEMQTVVWVLEAIDVDGKLHRKQGTTILMH